MPQECSRWYFLCLIFSVKPARIHKIQCVNSAQQGGLLLSGEVLLGDLDKHGFRITQDSEAVDCVLINTCGFVEDAKAESLEVGPPSNSICL